MGPKVSAPAKVASVRPEWAKMKFEEVITGEVDGGKPEVPGHMATAWVSLPTTGRNFTLTPNQAGEFPRIFCAPGETAQLSVAYVGLAPNATIAAAFADGGHSEGTKGGKAIVADAASVLSFPFTASDQGGWHRILLTAPDGDRKMLELWVGPPLDYTAVPGPSPIVTR